MDCRGTQGWALIALLLAASVPTAQTRSGRFLDRSIRVDANVTQHIPHEPPTTVVIPEDAMFEVLNKTKPETTLTTDCICPLGKFWHWRLHKCITQGAWGYECGFFPEEHKHRVCQDGLACKAIATADNYNSPGKFQGTARSRPATCVQCMAGDSCPTGEKRHQAHCAVEAKLTGDACVTVKITLPPKEVHVNEELSHTATATASATATAEATATASHTAEATASAQKSASAIAQATASAQAVAKLPGGETQTVTAEATESAEAQVTHSAEASEKATHEATASASATETFEAQASHTAYQKIATAAYPEPSVVEAIACVSVEEGKTRMGIEDVEGMGKVLSAELTTVMQEKALEEATKKALEKAMLDRDVSAEEAASIAKMQAA
mmetsp:Transcript_70831/g.179299  ORF Transcript_70831/g.179299 Transcript_70831/m.179299 type:complete len:384 (-) Transcript_70831:383-1534(-)